MKSNNSWCMFAALNNVFNLKWEEKSSKNRYKYVQIIKTCTYSKKEFYNIAHALVLCKSYWAIMNKIFMYARPCSIKWREQFHFSCKIFVEFRASSFCLRFGNVKIILNIRTLLRAFDFCLAKMFTSTWVFWFCLSPFSMNIWLFVFLFGYVFIII